MPKTVYIALGGGDDKGARMEFLCACENEETAILAAKGRAFYGGDGSAIKGIVVTEGDGTNFLLGAYGLTKGGQPRTINILEGHPSREQITQFLKAESEVKAFDNLRSQLSEEEVTLIKKFINKL